MKLHSILSSTLILSTVLTQSGCVPVAVMGAATTVTTAAAEERGVTGVYTDTEIRTRLNASIARRNVNLAAAISIDVHHGEILLTGTVPSPQDKIEIVKKAWATKGVKQVTDEIRVGGGHITEYAGDTWITTKIKTAMLLDENITSINYTVTTFANVVYVMGIALNQKELDRVLSLASNTNGVTKVVNNATIRKASPSSEETGSTDGSGFYYETAPSASTPDSPIQATPLS